MIILGDCIEEMKKLEANSVDAIVTDPPYGLSFMGKKWDYDVPSVEVWREALRVLKPGGHLLSFGGTRTYHRMVVAIEDAGFEIRDQVQWIYGSGFPKSHDVSKGIDKAAGVKPTPVGKKEDNPAYRANKDKHNLVARNKFTGDLTPTTPTTPTAQQWQGWGTALKPANEPIVLARKPLEKGLTVAQNVEKWGTGALNIDGSRIGVEQIEKGRAGRGQHSSVAMNELRGNNLVNGISIGRWPANVLFDESAAEMLDEQSGPCKTGAVKPYTRSSKDFAFPIGHEMTYTKAGDSGGASRFFYIAKCSKRERNAGLEGMPSRHTGTYAQDEWSRNNMGNTPDNQRSPVQNFHPTVKPIKLMEYLIKLITPPNGTVLDPFMGSGSTGCAAVKLGFKFIGIEMSEEYLEIAKKRIEHWSTINNEQLDLAEEA
jgi:site-specific DNA-methyltransferase (adenine-specific)